MRYFLYSLQEFLAEQAAYARLAWAQLVCRNRGHEDVETVLWDGDLVSCCPRCGAEEDE